MTGSSGGRGYNPFGKIPGPIGTPSPFSDLSSVYPNLGRTNAGVSADILSKLHGDLSPQTQQNIQDAAARFGVANGMPGAGGKSGTLVNNLNLRDLGISSENQVESGLHDYGNIIGAVSGTQTVKPELQTEIAATNAVNAAAPNPSDAASYALNLFKQYMNGGFGGGPAGGTAPAPMTSLLTRSTPVGAGGMRPWWATN